MCGQWSTVVVEGVSEDFGDTTLDAVGAGTERSVVNKHKISCELVRQIDSIFKFFCIFKKN